MQSSQSATDQSGNANKAKAISPALKIKWAHYQHPLPEYVYDVYMKYWKDVRLIQ